MYEASKAMYRRCFDVRYATRYLVGEGIDIGCGDDLISAYGGIFTSMKSVRPWDVDDGDAVQMAGVADESYDFVHSSHCLEHLSDPHHALTNWIRICKRGGHLLIVVPDEDMYEQGLWPSAFNWTHHWSFTIGKHKSWSPRSINVFDLLKPHLNDVSVQKIELLDVGYLRDVGIMDQTAGFLAESAIEIVLRRKTHEEVRYFGRYPTD